MRFILPILAFLSYSNGNPPPQFDQCLSIKGIGLQNFNIFTSPNFPDRYPPNVDCVRVIHSRPQHDVIVKFHHVFQIESTYDKIEAGEECPNDFIEFRDGRYGFSPLIARFCGDRMPKREIRAVSAEYAIVPSKTGRFNNHECLLEYLNGLDGFIRTKDLMKNLPQNASGTLDCVWRLAVPSNFRIAFYVKEFALKAPNQCAQNFVEVYSGDTSDKPLRRFCGLSANDVFSPSNEMFVRFYLSDVRSLNNTSISALFSSYTRMKNCTQEGLFACGDENCVPKSLACNGRPNCPYGRDERVCSVGQDTIFNFLASGFAPLVSIILIVLIVVSLICFYTIRKNHCGKSYNLSFHEHHFQLFLLYETGKQDNSHRHN
ncbi:hypothetical protein GCK72_002118 [Caenorhabditis remanei]|uniref:CUB domain-containing protein n=1 Tax=Caenorhabditis remanei TaxID=31234 RepID=A0A6A5HQ10_CAERE|nr:hypothetical protein GCK72_002118 [Caenorhabditis remanei]KAF1770300.1 hypothetical protein GCK72_002118 [Caenorhabditis remanei]